MNFTINVPATSANLGPGFDTLRLALDLWNETVVTPAKEFGVTVNGEGSDRLASGKNNLIVRAAGRLADFARMPLPPFHADCTNAIPLASGLGSSSAAIVTGMLAANALLGNRLSRDEILDTLNYRRSCSQERHERVLQGIRTITFFILSWNCVITLRSP